VFGSTLWPQRSNAHGREMRSEHERQARRQTNDGTIRSVAGRLHHERRDLYPRRRLGGSAMALSHAWCAYQGHVIMWRTPSGWSIVTPSQQLARCRRVRHGSRVRLTAAHIARMHRQSDGLSGGRVDIQRRDQIGNLSECQTVAVELGANRWVRSLRRF
jgi:hypothetical protein